MRADVRRDTDGRVMMTSSACNAEASKPEGAKDMTKTKSQVGVYRVTEIIGTSPISWEDAAKSAVETAAKSLRDLRIAEVTKLDLKVEEGKVIAYRARMSLSFKYEG
jgi:dodecin